MDEASEASKAQDDELGALFDKINSPERPHKEWARLLN
jgi:hypothetical protein